MFSVQLIDNMWFPVQFVIGENLIFGLKIILLIETIIDWN